MNDLSETQTYHPPVVKLLTLGDVRGKGDWLDYQAACGLTEADIPELIRMVQDEELNWADEDSDEVWAPLHAWRALGQLQAVEAIIPLVKLLSRIDEHVNHDWEQSELPEVLAMIGPDALPSLEGFLVNPRHGDFSRWAAAEAIQKIGERYPDYRAECVALLTRQLAKYRKQSPTLNGGLVSTLYDLQAVEAADTMAAAFKANKVDVSILGDWEEVQIKLGLLSERITPAPRRGWLQTQNPTIAKLDQLLSGNLGEETADPPPKTKYTPKPKPRRKANKKKRRR